MKRITGLLLALILLVGILPGQVRAIHEFPADAAVVYDGNAMAPFQNRTREEIGQKYAAALNANPAYGDRPTWYDRMPSLSAPYDQGKLSQAAADEMNAMTNYYRWLVGTHAMTGLSGNHDDLQKGALIRNWDFGHDVDVSKKPDDMDLSLWNEGANVAHNIIVMGAKPRNAIEAWLAEGYNASSAQWDTIGHRWCLLANAHSGMDFGYCGSVGIGRFLQNGTMTWGSNAFAAYPAPGWMPSSQINSKQSAWTVELNTGKLTYDKVADLTVTVTDLSGGSSYTCTSGNGKLRVDPYIYDRGTICFVQPAASGTCYAPGSSYRVVMTGLMDVATGKAASITYVVNFFDVTSYTPSATGNPFVDVKKGDFFYDAVLWAYQNDITAGTSKTKFSPYKTCTREQVVTFLWRAMGCQEPTGTNNPFKDVPADAYYTKAVLWAVENGITNGKSKTKFGVSDPCTREQVVTFLWRAEGEPEPTSAANPFKDVSETDYFYKAVLWAVENGITNGTSKTKFSPAKTCTRGEVVTFLYRDVVGEQ